MNNVVAIAMFSLVAFGLAQNCCAMEVKRVAPDGVNEITLEVDGQGYVQGECMTAVHVADRYIPQSGDRVIVNDIEYVLVSAGDWERWTNAVARLEAVAERRWANEHKTDEGRRAWHGALKERKQSDDGHGMVYTYADGFTYTEEVPGAKRTSPAVQRMKKSAEKQQEGESRIRPGGKAAPARLLEKRKAISARPAVKEVNAVFGPGGKVLKVEDK